jgi:hypothetical protein
MHEVDCQSVQRRFGVSNSCPSYPLRVVLLSLHLLLASPNLTVCKPLHTSALTLSVYQGWCVFIFVFLHVCMYVCMHVRYILFVFITQCAVHVHLHLCMYVT